MWRQERGVSEVQAVLYRTLAATPEPSGETLWLLERMHGKRRKGHDPADDVRQWLGVVARRELLGVTL